MPTSSLHAPSDLRHLTLYEAAYVRQRALLGMLGFLSNIPDHVTPSPELLGGAFACLEYLAEDAARLYEAAQNEAKNHPTG
ncbi:hypothetical protein N7408_25765 [Pseudomonas otitidis]|nr:MULTISPECIES: hypothetical protein [Pseudomonas]MDG9784619.1 hypothetical protein [Pseudomonas otitidis]